MQDRNASCRADEIIRPVIYNGSLAALAVVYLVGYRSLPLVDQLHGQDNDYRGADSDTVRHI